MTTAVTVHCATSNLGKLKEFRLAAPDFDVQRLPRPVAPPDETGETFEDNAIGKAEYYGAFTDGYLFADDSGLEVDALDGAPGAFSARYAGPRATDAENVARLLSELRAVSKKRPPTARFRCVLALARDGEVLGIFEGAIEGVIVDSPRGGSGFGYDPVFRPDGLTKTFAELSAEEKNQISHRARAIRLLRARLAK